MEKYGITLSGGGARGFAHIGVLAALEEAGIEPGIVSGTSMGAIIGLLYCSDFDSKEILEIVKKERFFDHLIWKLPGKLGMSSLKKLGDHLQEMIEAKTFEKLPKPLFIVASNISKAKGEIFSSGTWLKPVLASAAIPLVFRPIKIKGDFFIDGGLYNNFPVEPILDKCDKLIGSHVNHIADEKEFGNLIEIGSRCYQLAIYKNVSDSFDQCDVIIDPPEVMDYRIFDFRKADKLFEIGYEAAKKSLSSLKS
jgi:NTE family protein